MPACHGVTVTRQTFGGTSSSKAGGQRGGPDSAVRGHIPRLVSVSARKEEASIDGNVTQR
jgi:hypothetical protein